MKADLFQPRCATIAAAPISTVTFSPVEGHQTLVGGYVEFRCHTLCLFLLFFFFDEQKLVAGALERCLSFILPPFASFASCDFPPFQRRSSHLHSSDRTRISRSGPFLGGALEVERALGAFNFSLQLFFFFFLLEEKDSWKKSVDNSIDEGDSG